MPLWQNDLLFLKQSKPGIWRLQSSTGNEELLERTPVIHIKSRLTNVIW